MGSLVEVVLKMNNQKSNDEDFRIKYQLTIIHGISAIITEYATKKRRSTILFLHY